MLLRGRTQCSHVVCYLGLDGSQDAATIVLAYLSVQDCAEGGAHGGLD